VAVNMTTASDLTAIYNCSAFFAYAFSVPLLNDKLRFDKIFSVVVAIIGVLVVAYGDTGPGIGEGEEVNTDNRSLGNIIIGVGSVLYGLYEVLYKKLACPPQGTSPGRSMIFANTVGSCIGTFTLLVLWIPLPILHYTGWETFQWPVGKQASMMVISVLANASKFTLIPPAFTRDRLISSNNFGQLSPDHFSSSCLSHRQCFHQSLLY
jgi:drug/metabolite transporter (DMT)-like permease